MGRDVEVCQISVVRLGLIFCTFAGAFRVAVTVPVLLSVYREKSSKQTEYEDNTSECS